MSRILAIDFGQRRVGIAVTDTEQIISSGLTTVESTKTLAFLKSYFEDQEVECVVIGEAKNLDNTPSESSKYIEPFVLRFKQTFPYMKVVRIDERFTSKIAFQTMIDSGIKKSARRNKGLVDKVSATIILQSYLLSRK